MYVILILICILLSTKIESRRLLNEDINDDIRSINPIVINNTAKDSSSSEMNPIYIVIKNRNQQNIHDYDGGEYQIDQESPLCENCIERNSRSLNAYQKINEILNIKLTRKDLLPYEIQLITDLRRANRRWKVRRAIRRYLYRRSLYKDAVMNYYIQNKGVQHSGSDISKNNQPLSGLSQIHENHSKRKQDFEVKWKQSDSIDELIRVAHSTKEPKIKTEPTRSMSFTNILEKLLNDVNSKSTSTSNETDKFTTPELQHHMNKYRIDAIDNEILEATTQYYSLDAINENGTEKLNTDKTSSLEYNQISSTESNVSKKAQTIKLPSSEKIENYGEYDRTSDALISLGDLIQVTSKYDEDTLKAQPVFPVYSHGQPNTISESLKYFSGTEQDKYISSDLMLPTSDYKRDSHTTAIHTSTSSARYEQSYTPLKYHGNHTGSNVDNYDLNISKTITLGSKYESYTPGIKHEQSYMASKIDNTHSKEDDHESIDFKVEAFDHAQSSIALTQISDPIRNNGQPQSDISSEIYEYYTNSKPSEYNQSDVESLTSDYEQRSRYADTGSNKNDFKPNDYNTATLDYKEDSSTLETKSSTDTTEQQYNTSRLYEFSIGSEQDEYKYSDIMMTTSNYEQGLITSSTQTRVSTTKYEQPEKTSEYYKSKSDNDRSYLSKPPTSENKQHSNYLSTNGLTLTSSNKQEEYESRYLKPITSTYAQSYTEKEMITSTPLAVQERHITSENYESDTSHPQDHFILRDFEASTFEVELGSNTETVQALISTDRREQSDKASDIYDYDPPSEIDDYKSSDFKTTLDYDQYPSSSALHTSPQTVVHDRSDMTSDYYESGTGSEHDNYEPSILTLTTNDHELNSSTIKIHQTDNPAIQPDMTDEGYGYHIDSEKTEYKSTDFQTIQSDDGPDYVPSATYGKETSITEFGELNINGKQKEYESRYLKSITSTYAQSHTEKEMITSTPIAVQERHITSENYESDTSHPQEHFILRDFEPSTFDVELGSNTETVHALISTDRREQSDIASEIYDNYPPSEIDDYKSSDFKTTLDYDQYPSSSALHTLTHTAVHDRSDMTSDYSESGTLSEHDNFSILTPTTNYYEQNLTIDKFQVPLSAVRNEEYDVISEYHDYKSSRLMPTKSNYELGLSTGLAQTTVPTSSIHEQSGISSESYQFGSVSLPIPHDHDQNSSLSPTYIIGSYNVISSFDKIKSSDIKKSQLSFEEDKYVTDSTVLPHEYLNDISTDFRSSLLGRYTNDLSNSESTDVIELYTNSNSSSSPDSIFANSPTSPKTHEQYLEDISIEKDYVIVSEDKPNFIENFDSSSSYSEDVDIIDLISTDDFEEFPNSIKPSYSGNEYVDNNSNDIYQEFSQSTRMSNYNGDSITSLKVNDFSQSTKPLINDDLQSSYFDGVPTAESAKLYSIAQNLRDTTSDIDYNYDEHKLVKTGYAKPIMPEYKLDDLKFNRTVGLTDQDQKISHILSNTKQLLISTEFDRLVGSTLENHQLNINSSVDLMLSTNVSTDTAVLSQTESSELFSTPSTSNQFTGYIGSIQHSKLSATVSTEFDTLLLNNNGDVQSNDHVDSSKQSVDLKLSTTTLGNKAESLTASNNLKNSETSEDHLGDIVDSTERKQYLIDVLAENLDKLSIESNGFTGSALDDVQFNVHSTDNLIIDTNMKRYMPMTTDYSGLIISQTSSKADSTGNDNSSKARTSDLSVSKSVSVSSIKEDVLELKRQYASVSELLKMCRNFLYRHLQNVN